MYATGVDTVVRQALHALEVQAGVRVLYAAYSGSHVRGYAGPDSDTDVRCLYLRPPSWYLALPGRRCAETLDRHSSPLVAELEAAAASAGVELDVVGWDMRKALPLVGHSNAMLWEWLGVPSEAVLYRSPEMARLDALRAAFYSPRACLHYYLGLVRRSAAELGVAAEVSLKTYVTLVYGLLVAQWVAAYTDEMLRSLELGALLADPALAVPRTVRHAVERWVELRAEGEQEVPREEAVEEWRTQREAALVTQLRQWPGATAGGVTTDPAPLNALFLALLGQAWALRWG